MLFKVKTMVPDIFYLMFILTVSVLVCFTQKKSKIVWVVLHTGLQQAVVMDPCGGYSSP